MPKNTIGWGQGAINNSRGWGSGASNNTRNWGWLHSRSYGHDETNLTGSPSMRYIGAVTADGGTISSVPCVSRSFYNLDQINLSISQNAIIYQAAVEADSGIVSSVNCVSDTFKKLDNINV